MLRPLILNPTKSNVSPQQNANTSVGMPASNCTNSIFPNSEDCISNFWAKFHREKKQHKYLKGLALDSVRLSFISHALAIQLLDSKPVTEMCSPDNVQHLFSEVEIINEEITKIHDEKIKIVNFTHNEDALRSLACVSVTRFINDNYRKVRGEEILSSFTQKTYYSETFYGDDNRTFTVTSSHTLYGRYTRGQVVTGTSLRYNEIPNFLKDLDKNLKVFKTATLIRQILRNEFTNISPLLDNKSLCENEVRRLVSITYLLFVCEPSRNPAAFIHHQMLLDLKINNHITWRMFFDLMPMRPDLSVTRARSLNQLYHGYLPINYQYDCTEGTEGPQFLIRAEATVVKIWLNKIKGINRSDLAYTKNKDVINFIKTGIQGWYGIALNNNIEEDEYTEDQIITFLKPEKPSDYTVLTPVKVNQQFYMYFLILEIFELPPLIIIPIKLVNNCWAGLFVRNQKEYVELIYVDRSNFLDDVSYPEVVGKIQSQIHTPDIVNLDARNFLHRPYQDDCGPREIQIFKGLAKALSCLDRWDVEQIIELMKDQEIEELKKL
eukprot:gene12733-13948_t